MSPMKSGTFGLVSHIGFNNATNGLVGSIGIVCFVLVGLQNLIRSLFDPNYGYVPGVIIAMLWLAILSGYLGAKYSQRCNRGDVVLDCGPTQNRMYFILCAIFMAGFSIAGGFLGPVETYWKTAGVVRLQEADSSWFNGNPEIWRVSANFVVCATLSFSYVFFASGRTVVTKLGIWNHWGLLKWEAIDAWEFHADDPTWLVMHSNSQLPFLRTGVLKVSEACRERLAGLLRENVHER